MRVLYLDWDSKTKSYIAVTEQGHRLQLKAGTEAEADKEASALEDEPLTYDEF